MGAESDEGNPGEAPGEVGELGWSERPPYRSLPEVDGAAGETEEPGEIEGVELGRPPGMLGEADGLALGRTDCGVLGRAAGLTLGRTDWVGREGEGETEGREDPPLEGRGAALEPREPWKPDERAPTEEPREKEPPREGDAEEPRETEPPDEPREPRWAAQSSLASPRTSAVKPSSARRTFMMGLVLSRESGDASAQNKCLTGTACR